jgi:hypothetical protein
MQSSDILCPAGELVAGAEGGGVIPGCHCRIADELVGAASNTRSFLGFCCGQPRRCPTWQTRHEAEGRDEHRKLEREIAQDNPTRPVRV